MALAADLASPRQGRYRTALASADLRRLLAAFVMVESGAWSYSVVLSVFVFTQTGSAAAVGAMISVRWITGMLAAGPAGVIADRYERRKVLVTCSLLVTLVMLGMLLLIVADAPIWMLAAASSLNALVESPNGPAAGALIPQIVDEDDLVTANVMLNLLENIVIVVGPLLGGLLILTGSPAIAIGINACTYAIGALIYLRMSVRSYGDEAEAGDSLVTQWKTGIVALGSRPHALALLACVVLSTAMYGGQVVMFLAMSGDLGMGDSGLSYLLAAIALGGVLVAVVANRIAAMPSLAYVVVGSLLVESLPFIAISFTTSAPLILALLVVSGAGTVMVDVIANTSFQRIMPNHLLGRTLATVTMVALLAGSLATMIAARLIDAVGVSRTEFLFGAVLAIGGVLVLPVLRRGEASEGRIAGSLVERVALIES
ncbi:MAG TPA: MFS transporter, partial [Thermomicrobiales bacterium]|nr:MFS transporter [Thermomicrobiales bacterium]